MCCFADWRYRWLVPVAVSVAVVALFGSQFSNFSLSDSREPKSGVHADEQLVVALHSGSTARYDFGELTRGARAEKSFILRNPGSAAATVREIRTSCECLRVDLARRTIGPGESTTGAVIIDLRSEPRSAGGLLLRAEGWVDGGPAEPAFVIEAGADVR